MVFFALFGVAEIHTDGWPMCGDKRIFFSFKNVLETRLALLPTTFYLKRKFQYQTIACLQYSPAKITTMLFNEKLKKDQ